MNTENITRSYERYLQSSSYTYVLIISCCTHSITHVCHECKSMITKNQPRDLTNSYAEFKFQVIQNQRYEIRLVKDHAKNCQGSQSTTNLNTFLCYLMLYLLFVCLFVCSLADLLVFSISKDHERSSLTLVRIRGGGDWEDFRGTQPFQREWSAYHSFLENYEGGTIDNCLSTQGVHQNSTEPFGGEIR